MNSDFYTIEYIDQYLAGSLSLEEQQTFEQAMDLLPDLEEEVRFQILAKGVSFNAGRQKWIQEGQRELRALKKRKQGKRHFIWIRVAALILLVLSIGLTLIPVQNEPNHFPEPAFLIDPAPLLRQDGKLSTLRQGYQAFNEQQYSSALSIWNTLPLPMDLFTQNELAYYRGLSYLALEQLDSARYYLYKVEEPAYRSRAQWNLAISWLNEQQVQKALPILQALSAHENPLQPQAESLLRRIQK